MPIRKATTVPNAAPKNESPAKTDKASTTAAPPAEQAPAAAKSTHSDGVSPESPKASHAGNLGESNQLGTAGRNLQLGASEEAPGAASPEQQSWKTYEHSLHPTAEVAELSPDQRKSVAEKAATCPFMGSAVASGDLPVRNDAAHPLASVDDVVKLGNTGGGDLGTVLSFFAKGNHAFMENGVQSPDGTFSLHFPSSQGAHPGHSGILLGKSTDPVEPGKVAWQVPRFSDAEFQRLTSRAQDGLIPRSEFGKFIAENVHADPEAKAFGRSLLGVVDTLKSVSEDYEGKTGDGSRRELVSKAAALAGSNNLIGSAGEFGLLFAFLENKPGARTVGGEPAISVDDLTAMFKEKRFPEGWEQWPKTSGSWLRNTAALGTSAAAAYAKLALLGD